MFKPSLRKYAKKALAGDTKTDAVLPQLGSVALESGHHAGENIARLVEDKKTEPFKYFDKARWRPSVAVPQSCRGHTDER